MRSIIQSDSGTSYGIFVVGMFFLLGTAIIIMMSPMVNYMTDEYNDMVTDTSMHLSTLNADAYGFFVNVVKSLPVFVLIGLIAWAIIRALEEKEYAA